MRDHQAMKRTHLNNDALALRKKQALSGKCSELREIISARDPGDLARRAALSLLREDDGSIILTGDYLLENCRISWPDLVITGEKGQPVSQRLEALWLHYLAKADGHPLAGRWVNLSEIGGLFYQQAFQGYCGDELAAYWGNNLDGLAAACHHNGGWPVHNLGDLAFAWRLLPRLSLCLCYRNQSPDGSAWATMLFDASTNHYVAADVAATVAKELADRLVKL